MVIGETPAAPRDILLCLKLHGFGQKMAIGNEI
jgi:hypothetical protein